MRLGLTTIHPPGCFTPSFSVMAARGTQGKYNEADALLQTVIGAQEKALPGHLVLSSNFSNRAKVLKEKVNVLTPVPPLRCRGCGRSSNFRDLTFVSPVVFCLEC